MLPLANLPTKLYGPLRHRGGRALGLAEMIPTLKIRTGRGANTRKGEDPGTLRTRMLEYVALISGGRLADLEEGRVAPRGSKILLAAWVQVRAYWTVAVIHYLRDAPCLPYKFKSIRTRNFS